MIPKIIHYCWFGGTPLPKSALKCIASWKKFLPDYEIKEWNESNFNVQMIPYTREAYAARKFAFVSDFARFWLLYQHGGLYFDTDVEVIAPMDDILEKGAYMGIEAKTTSMQEHFYVAPGLGFACEANNPIWSSVIEKYMGFECFNFEKQGTICTITTDVLTQHGIKLQDEVIEHAHLTIYPPDYFCPQAMRAAPVHLTHNTRSIHHYDATWLPRTTRLRCKIRSLLPTSWVEKFRSIRRTKKVI